MRTSGPCRPPAAGRRRGPAGGSGPAAPSSRRSSWTTSGRGRSCASPLVAAGHRVVHEQHVGVAAVAQLGAAEPAHRRPRAAGCGARPRSSSTRRTAMSSARVQRGGGEVGEGRTRRRRGRAARSGRPTATRNSSRRRTPAPPSIAASADSLRRVAASISACRAARGRGLSPPSSPSMAHRLRCAQQQVGGVAAARPARAPAARRPLPSSRSSRRYQWVVPERVADAAGRPSSPASGSASSANHPSITGSSVRWIAARRLTPGGQRLDVPQRPGRVAEAERLEPLARGLRGQPRLAGVEPGDGGAAAGGRTASRAVGAPRARCRLPLAPPARAAGVAPVPDRAAEPAQVGLVVGHEVGAPQPVQLDAGAPACAGTGRRRSSSAASSRPT